MDTTKLAEIAEVYEAQLDELACSDHGCVVSKPKGMGTNGGCSCVPRGIHPDQRVMLRKALTLRQQQADDLVAEVRRLTAALATVTAERDALLAVCERFAGDEGVICNGYEGDSGCGSCGANANHSDADPANHAPDCARLAARVLAAKIRGREGGE